MRNVLLLVHADPGQECRLQAALDLTRALNGHLSCLDITVPPRFIADYYSTAGGMILLEDERALERENRSTVEARLAREGVPWDWADATGDIAHCILARAKLADIIVLSRQLDSALLPDMRGITSRIVIHARKPVLAMPEKMTRFIVDGRALVAWDGSAAATEAMRAAIPLLTRASDVRLFAVDDRSRPLSLSEAAAYLSRHGIHSSIRCVADGRHAADQWIEDECAGWHADYVVMGAYGHSLLAEAVFGGVTRRMLAGSPLPLVLGH